MSESRTATAPKSSSAGGASLPEHQRIRVVLAVSDTAVASWVRDTLAEHPLVDVIAEAQDGLEAAQLSYQLRPSLCVVQAELPVMSGLETCELIGVASPDVPTVLVTTGATHPLAQAAMRAGSRACTTVGAGAHDLLAAVADIHALRSLRDTREYSQVTDTAMMPSIIAISSAKGGVGKTTLACNLAVTLAGKHEDDTILVDLYSQYGDVALMLGLGDPGHRNIGHLVSGDAEIDDASVEAHVMKHSSGLRLIPGATRPGAEMIALPVESVARLLTILRRQFRVIVIDLPPQITPAAVHVISRCQHFIVVCNFMELTTLRDTSLLLGGVIGRYTDGDRVTLCGNRVLRKNRYLASDLEKATGQRVRHLIPNAADLPLNAINTGTPFVMSHPRAPISASIRDLASALDGADEPRPSEDVARGNGKLGK